MIKLQGVKKVAKGFILGVAFCNGSGPSGRFYKGLKSSFKRLRGQPGAGLIFDSLFGEPPAEAGAAGFAQDGEGGQAVVVPEGVQLQRGGNIKDRPAGKENRCADEKLPRAGEVILKNQTHWRQKISVISKDSP